MQTNLMSFVIGRLPIQSWFPSSASASRTIRWGRIRVGAWLAVAFLCGLGWAESAIARPPIRDAFFQEYPTAVGTILDKKVASFSGGTNAQHCGVCHFKFGGGGTRNPYGSAVEAVYSTNGKDARAAVQAVRAADSDSDGFSNDTEVTNRVTYANTPTFPGLTPGNLGSVSGVTNLNDILPYLVPATGVDNTPPNVTLVRPNGGEVLTANSLTNVQWTASDASGVAGVDIYLSIDNGTNYSPIAKGLANTGSYAWFPANRPVTNFARIRLVVVDNAGNSTNKSSANPFTILSPAGGRVPSTLSDFDMPGSQPLELRAALSPPQDCAGCHGNYNTQHEPYFNWQGSMMAHASIDPLFEANLAIANQDAPDSGDLCLRCHIHAGWVQGRSVPTSGAAMLTSDKFGVACDLCHRMMDPIYAPGVSPSVDQGLLAGLLNPGTNFGIGMVHLDPDATRRGPFVDATSAHPILVSPFHREAALCGTCHDVSNPAFERDANGVYQPNAFNAPATDFSPHKAGPVERTYSEWLASDFNTPAGVYLPQFAGNKTNGMVATCQDCHMRDIAGHGADTNQFGAVPLRQDLPLHDMTGSSTWMPMLLASLHPTQVPSNAAAAGVVRATYMLENAAELGIADAGSQLQVSVTNNCGHKLPTGYPEGRRMWLNVKFFDAADQPVGESGAYDSATGELSHDGEPKIYEVHPGIDTNINTFVGLPAGPSLHFVLNNKIYEDNRIPPRGFTNAAFATFGGAPTGYSYADGQYWDDTHYTIPPGAVRAEVALLFQSTSKEFIEFLRTNNVTNLKGEQLYSLWDTNSKCPPTTMQAATWQTPFLMESMGVTPEGGFEMLFHCRPGETYTVEHTDQLTPSDWQPVTHTPTNTPTLFVDTTTSPTGMRFYRVRYDGAP